MTATPTGHGDQPLIEPWELVAREHIRDSLARYTWSGDALRVDQLALAFCEDGVLEVRGQPRLEGRAAIATFIGGVGATPAPRGEPSRPGGGPPRIVRHNVANIRFTEIHPTAARVESYFTVFTEIGLDHLGRYRDSFVPVDGQWLIEHRFVSTDWRAPGSAMAPSATVEKAEQPHPEDHS